MHACKSSVAVLYLFEYSTQTYVARSSKQLPVPLANTTRRLWWDVHTDQSSREIQFQINLMMDQDRNAVLNNSRAHSGLDKVDKSVLSSTAWVRKPTTFLPQRA